jgi:two-component system sporulation sensor kinase C
MAEKAPLTGDRKRDVTTAGLLEELRRSEAQYRSTINSMTDALHVVDRDLRIVLMNRAFLEWHERLGLPGDVVGKALTEVYDFLPARVEEEYRRIFETGEPLSTDELTRVGDSEIATETRKIPVFKRGKVVEVITMIRDITGRRQAEQALRASEEKYANLFRSSNDAILLHDMAGNIIDVNRRTLDFLGYEKEEILRVQIQHLHPPEARPISEEAFAEIARHGHVNFEIEFKRKDGSVFPAEVSASIFDVSGQKVIQGIVRDITERKTMEDALRQSEAKFKALAEGSPNMIFMNQMGKIVYVNRKCTEIMGYTREELYAPDFDFFRVASPDAIEGIARGYSAFLEGRPCHSHETALVAKSGRKIDCIVSWNAVDYGHGKAMLGVVTDITDRKRMEEALRVSEEKYRSFVENFHGIAYQGGLDGTPVFFHGDVQRITGYAEEDFLNGEPSWADIILPEDRGGLRGGPGVAGLPNGEAPTEREYRINRRDGQTRWIHQSLKPVRDRSGAVIYLQGALYDVTERKAAEATVARERSAFGLIVDAATRSGNVREACDRVLCGLLSTLVFDCGTVRLYDPESRMLRLVCARGFTPPEVDRYIHDQHIEDRRYVAAMVGRNQRAVWAPDITQTEDLKKYRARCSSMGVSSMISWPLISTEGNLLGVMHLLGRTPKDIPEEDRDFFKTVGELFVVVLERKQAEQAIERSRASYQSRFENSPIALWEEDFSGAKRRIDDLWASGIRDFDTYFKEHPEEVLACAEAITILGANRAAMELLNTKTVEDFARVSTANVRERTFDSFRKGLTLAAQGNTEFDLDYETITAEGKVRFVRLRWSVAPGYDKSLERVLVSVVDLTERREAEEVARRAEIQLRRYSEELEEMVKDRAARIKELERQRAESEKLAATGRMAARIAHEINNPLAGIKNSFLLLRKIMDKEHPHYHYADRVQNEIDRIAQIIRKMFDLYSPDPKKMVQVSFNDTIRDVVNIMESTFRAAGIEVALDLPETPIEIALPVGYLDQVLFNLVQNAVEASDAGDVITISAGFELDAVVVTVSDSGCGVPPGLRDRIFEPFFTTKGETGGKGLGLGLAVSKGMVEAMGGTITLRDNVPRGTVFTVTLPRREKAKED